MTTATEKTPAGWKDGLFYPDGFNGKAFGVQLIEIAKGEHKVVYPMVNKPEQKVEVAPAIETPAISVQKIPPASESKHYEGKGRPPVQLTPRQLSYLNKDLSIRQKAKAMGISKSKVAELMKDRK